MENENLEIALEKLTAACRERASASPGSEFANLIFLKDSAPDYAWLDD